jgi:hypothetical protein
VNLGPDDAGSARLLPSTFTMERQGDGKSG